MQTTTVDCRLLSNEKIVLSTVCLQFGQFITNGRGNRGLATVAESARPIRKFEVGGIEAAIKNC